MKRKLGIAILLLLSVITLVACESAGLTDTSSDDDTSNTVDTDDDDMVVDVDEIEVGEGSVVLDDPYEDHTYYNYVDLEPSTDTIEITIGGYYVLEGTYSNIVIDTYDEDVDLILNNATISSESGPAVLVLSADEVTLSALEDTVNYIEDSSNHPLDGEEDYNAAIYSYVDLEFNGTGTLAVSGNYNNAVYTKDDIKIQDITMYIESVDDGIVGRDYVAVSNAYIEANVDGDAICSTNTESADKGFIYIESGEFVLTAGDDAIQGALAVLIYDGTFDIYSSDNGIQSNHTIYIEGGTFVLDSEDAVNATVELEISGGDFTINAQDDGIHSDELLTINGGNIYIESSYEGIEGYVIIINDGNIIVNSTDDGINATAGGGQAHGQEVYISDGGSLYINGGTIKVNSVSDGVDVNGAAEMTGGYLLVYGSTTDMQSSIDYDESFNISGGTVIALGSDGMLQTLSSTSTQASLTYADMTSYASGTMVILTDGEDNVILEVAALKYFEAVTISSPDLEIGESYTLTVGTDTEEFTVTSTLTSLGSGGSGMTDGGLPPRR